MLPFFTGLTHPKTFHDQLKSLKSTIESSSHTVKVQETSPPPESIQQIKPPVLKPLPQPKQQQIPAVGYIPYGKSPNCFTNFYDLTHN